MPTTEGMAKSTTGAACVVGAAVVDGATGAGVVGAGVVGTAVEDGADAEDSEDAAGEFASSSRSRAEPMTPTTRNRARTANQGRW